MNYLITTATSNYKVENIRKWVESSKYEGITRVIFYYKKEDNPDLEEYLTNQDLVVLTPGFDYKGGYLGDEIVFDSGLNNPTVSEYLVHHIRFLHYSWYLKGLPPDSKVLCTDCTDVVFNRNPFQHKVWNGLVEKYSIIASSEEVTIKEHPWNYHNHESSMGVLSTFSSQNTLYNAGCIAGESNMLADLFSVMYLLCINKSVNTDQAVYNHLIHTILNSKVYFSDLSDRWGIHLHVVGEGRVDIGDVDIEEFCIVHQYDRIGKYVKYYDEKYR